MKTRKIFIILTLILLCVVLLPSCTGGKKNKDDTSASEGLAFTENSDGTYCVISVGDCQDENIVIPAKHNGKPVTRIADYAFWNCRTIKSVKIPEGITHIGYEAFAYCESLSSVVIPASIKEISDSVFASCTVLYDIYFSGTASEWFAIEKSDEWNSQTPLYVIRCTDRMLYKFDTE